MSEWDVHLVYEYVVVTLEQQDPVVLVVVPNLVFQVKTPVIPVHIWMMFLCCVLVRVRASQFLVRLHRNLKIHY